MSNGLEVGVAEEYANVEAADAWLGGGLGAFRSYLAYLACLAKRNVTGHSTQQWGHGKIFPSSVRARLRHRRCGKDGGVDFWIECQSNNFSFLHSFYIQFLCTVYFSL